VAAVTVWLLFINAGMGLLWLHTLTPGEPAQSPTDWPPSSRLQRAADGYTILMWCHPQCPCTRASLSELARLRRLSGDRLSTLVVFERPDKGATMSLQGENWRLASEIPAARVLVDDGEEARRFRVHTSGQALIFDPQGRLRFNGGLTAGRGHLGDNAAFQAARRLVLQGQEPPGEAPVFGCALFNAADGPAPASSRPEPDLDGGTSP
jgi:hypothetical protein